MGERLGFFEAEELADKMSERIKKDGGGNCSDVEQGAEQDVKIEKARELISFIKREAAFVIDDSTTRGRLVDDPSWYLHMSSLLDKIKEVEQVFAQYPDDLEVAEIKGWFSGDKLDILEDFLMMILNDSYEFISIFNEEGPKALGIKTDKEMLDMASTILELQSSIEKELPSIMALSIRYKNTNKGKEKNKKKKKKKKKK